MQQFRDPHSGALVFAPEPHEIQLEEQGQALAEQAELFAELRKEISGLKGTITKLSNRVKELEAPAE